MQDSVPVGLLNYSKGPSNAVPSPITYLQGGPLNLIFNTPQNVLDFTGLARAIFTIYVADFTNLSVTNTNYINAIWNGSAFVFPVQPAAGTGAVSILVQASGNVLQLKNQILIAPTPNVYYSLKLHRLQ
jgi:hypothetical protein